MGKTPVQFFVQLCRQNDCSDDATLLTLYTEINYWHR